MNHWSTKRHLSQEVNRCLHVPDDLANIQFKIVSECTLLLATYQKTSSSVLISKITDGIMILIHYIIPSERHLKVNSVMTMIPVHKNHTWIEKKHSTKHPKKSIKCPWRSLETVPEDYLKKLEENCQREFRLCWGTNVVTPHIHFQALK